MALLARTIVVCEVRRGDKPAGNSAWLSVRSPGFRYIPAPSSFAAVTGLSPGPRVSQLANIADPGTGQGVVFGNLRFEA